MKSERSVGRLGAGLSILFLSGVLVAVGGPLFDAADRWGWDLLMAGAKPATKTSPPITMVTIDEESFAALKRRWPWPREWLAQAVDRASEAGAVAIGIDISLGDPGFNAAEDEVLASALARSTRVVAVDNLENTASGTVRRGPVPLLAAALAGTGYANLLTDPDGVVRRTSFVESLENGSIQVPSFSAALASLWFASRGEEAKIDAIPEKALVDYRWAGPGGFPSIPFHLLRDGTFDPSLVKGRILLIGATFRESHDFVVSPFAGPRASGQVQYGIEVHAHQLATLLSDAPLVSASEPLRLGLLLAVFALVILALAFFPFYWGMGLSLVPFLGGAAIVAWLFWSQGTWLAPGLLLLPLLAGAPVAVFYHFAVEAREKRKVTSYFSRYVSPRVVDSLLGDGHSIELGGELREVAILFSDIRDFTPLSEGLAPKDLVNLLNAYFDEMVDCVFLHEGTVNKFIGDAIMVIYGAPVRQADAAMRAVQTALDMRQALARFNARQEAAGLSAIRIGIGVHFGQVVVGNVGSKRQMEYTVIGDVVNTCSRLESYTKEAGCDIIISEEVLRASDGSLETQPLPGVHLKGKAGTLTVHRLIDQKRSST